MTDPNENPSPSLETPSAPVPAEPPAAALVRDGLGAAEALALRQELEAERKARAEAEAGRKSAETKASEAERAAQELKALTMAHPAGLPPVPPKAKRERRFPTLLTHEWKS